MSDNINSAIYGSYFGGDFGMRELKNGWAVVNSALAGYTGARQSYANVTNYQNGAALGVASTFYKNDFFIGTTLGTGYMNNQASTMYGRDNFNTLSAGVATKFGNNFEWKKLITQPSMVVAYTFANTFDYKTSAGVDIKSDPLHAVTLQPGLKFIANFEKVQPYVAASGVWNCLERSKVKAHDIHLPQLSMKPYAEYGLGVQSAWKDRYSGFLQTMFRSGGRTGIAFAAGLNIALGKAQKREAL
jgi:hypothetical protein